MGKEKLTLADCFKYPNAGIMTEFGKSAINKILIGAEALTLWMHDRPVEYLKTVGVEHCQLILRSIDQLTEDEILEIGKIIVNDNREFLDLDTILVQMKQVRIADYLRSRNIDIDGFIENGKAVKS